MKKTNKINKVKIKRTTKSLGPCTSLPKNYKYSGKCGPL